MIDKPESTAHHHATKLDVLAAAMFAKLDGDCTQSLIGMAEDYQMCEARARELIAELDKLNAGKGDANK